MRLYGYQCDYCKVRSRDKPGRWIQVQSMLVKADGDWTIMSTQLISDGLHYCSTKCLEAAMKEDWKE